MHNLWLVAQHEYARRVRKRSFILAVIGIPLLLIMIIGVTILVISGKESDLPVGYVDEAGVLDTAVALPDNSIPFLPFAAEEAARQAVLDGELQAYFRLPAGYPQQTQLIDFYYKSEFPSEIKSAVDALIRANLTQGLPEATQQLLAEDFSYTVRSADGRREQSQDDWLSFVIPFVAALFFFVAVIGSTGYLLQAVADEKENRTVEMMVTSMSPEQLVGGKALGLLGVSLTQVGSWAATAVIGITIAARNFEPLQTATIPWVYLGVVLLFFVPTFALIAGIMTAIGGAVTELQQGQQIAGVLNLIFVAPLFFTGLLLVRPNSPLVVFMTLFPATSFMTVALRWGVSNIPVWQLVVGWLLLVVTAVLAVWAAARIFRAGMLRYGQRLSMRRMWASVRTPQAR